VSNRTEAVKQMNLRSANQPSGNRHVVIQLRS